MSRDNESQITRHEKLTTYNIILAEAIFELLVEKGVLTKEELLERIEKLSRITHIIIQNKH